MFLWRSEINPDKIVYLRTPSQSGVRALLASGEQFPLTNRERRVIARTPDDWDDILVLRRLDNKKRLAVYKRKRFRNQKYKKGQQI